MIKKSSIRLCLLAAFFCAGVFAAAPCPAPGANGKPVTLRFIPLWSHQAQFAGYYMAQEKGFYRKHGLDVRIVDGGPQAPAESSLKSGQADVAVLWLSSALRLQNSGTKVVNIGQIVRKSALMLVAKKSSGITTPADLNGRKISVWPDFDTQPKAFFSKKKIKANIVTQSHSVNLFLTGAVSAACAMWYNEYHTILNSGLNADELVCFFPADYGVNFPEDGIYMTQTAYSKNPEAACAFAKASIEGWLYAFEHPQEAIASTIAHMQRVRLPANTAHQTWMLNALKASILPEGAGPAGRLDRKDYEFTAQELKKAGIIKSFPAYADFYKGCIK